MLLVGKIKYIVQRTHRTIFLKLHINIHKLSNPLLL